MMRRMQDLSFPCYQSGVSKIKFCKVVDMSNSARHLIFGKLNRTVVQHSE